MTGAAHRFGVAECGRNARVENTLTRRIDPQLAPHEHAPLPANCGELYLVKVLVPLYD